jgi:putative oxidoreductase
VAEGEQGDMADIARHRAAAAARPGGSLAGPVLWSIGLLERAPDWLIALIARVAIADVFWRSGQTKVAGFSIAPTTFALFEEEYKVPLLPPDVAAYMATIAEHLFPALLVIGLASRFSALGLLFMTLVIQAFVYPEAWPDHILWLAILLYIAARGPGALSIDHLIRRRHRDAAGRRHAA